MLESSISIQTVFQLLLWLILFTLLLLISCIMIFTMAVLVIVYLVNIAYFTLSWLLFLIQTFMKEKQPSKKPNTFMKA